jgi:hypothetical protein
MSLFEFDITHPIFSEVVFSHIVLSVYSEQCVPSAILSKLPGFVCVRLLCTDCSSNSPLISPFSVWSSAAEPSALANFLI